MSFKAPSIPCPTRWVLDANVLFSAWGRCLVALLAGAHQAELMWSDLVEEEAYRNLVRLGRLSAEEAALERLALADFLKAQRLPPANPNYFADLRAVDEKDRHVAALALELVHQTQSPVAIITWNLKDFPRKPLLKHKIVRYNPEELFLTILTSCKKALLDAESPAMQPESHCGPKQSCMNKAMCMELLLESFNKCRSFKKIYPRQTLGDIEEDLLKAPSELDSWANFLRRNRLPKIVKYIEIV